MSLTDTIGSLAVATKGQWMTGVSTDIGTSFVKPAGKPGDVLHARGVLTAMGLYQASDIVITANVSD
jgi:acyl-coenzyme A thioesterase 13